MTGPWLKLTQSDGEPVLVNMARIETVRSDLDSPDTLMQFTEEDSWFRVTQTLDEIWEMLNDQDAGYLMREPHDLDGKLTRADDDWPVGPAPFQYPGSSK